MSELDAEREVLFFSVDQYSSHQEAYEAFKGNIGQDKHILNFYSILVELRNEILRHLESQKSKDIALELGLSPSKFSTITSVLKAI